MFKTDKKIIFKKKKFDLKSIVVIKNIFTPNYKTDYFL